MNISLLMLMLAFAAKKSIESDEISANSRTIATHISKVKILLKKIERNPNMYLNSREQSNKCRISVRPQIPLGVKHCYGNQTDKAVAQGAVLMIVKEYLKSLELVRDGRLKSPATVADLQAKYDSTFPNSDLAKFETTLKKIEASPNFGLQRTTQSYFLQMSVPPGARHFYGSHRDYGSARKAVLLIATEYMKSLERVRDGTAEHPMTPQDLRLIHDAMFSPKPKSRLISKFENTLKKIEKCANFGLLRNGNRYYVNVKIPTGAKHFYGFHADHTTARKAIKMIADEYMKSLELAVPATFYQLKLKYDATFGENASQRNSETDKTSKSVAYKIERIYEDEPDGDYYLGGYFKVLNPPDVFWVNTIKKVDGRLSGYYKEYGGCRGWVNLEYLDFEPKEVEPNWKRKREESYSCKSEKSTNDSESNY